MKLLRAIHDALKACGAPQGRELPSEKRLFRELRKRGAQGVILGSTEIPLIIDQSDVPIPVFDTTRLHSRMAVDFILGRYLPRDPK